MSGSVPGQDSENAQIVLGLLESVERDGAQSQRRLAADLGIALGLVNTYLKRCVNKGLVKVSEAPARRYAYYLTPQGFAEKSRLTVEYLSSSFGFFRQAKGDCLRVLEQAKLNGVNRVVLAGCSDLAEIAAICAMETGATIVCVWDPRATVTRFAGQPVTAGLGTITGRFDAIMITDLTTPLDTYAAAAAHIGGDRVLVPNLLRIQMRQPNAAVAS